MIGNIHLPGFGLSHTDALGDIPNIPVIGEIPIGPYSGHVPSD